MFVTFGLVVAVLFSVTQASFNLSAALLELPACTILCSTKMLTAANCQPTDLQDCLCRNNTLQNDLFVCVLATCNLTEQIISAQVNQNLICDGIPQPSRSKEIIRVISAISAITFPFVVLRGVSRYLVTKFWWDDWIVLIAGILLIPMSAIPLYNATKGFGDHLWNVPPENIIIMEQLYYVSSILYAICVTLPRISILFFYLRIFPDDRFRLVAKIAIAAISSGSMAFTFAVIFQCSPIRGAWDVSTDAQCISSKGIIYSGAAISILEDFVVMLLPIPQLKSLSLSLQKRIALIFMFAIGSFACVTSMYRLKWLIWYQLHSLDATWVNVDPVIWSVLEVFSAMICSSLMTVRPLLAKYFPRLFTSTQHSQNHETYNTIWRTRLGFQQLSQPWSGNHGVELPSQEKFVEHGNYNKDRIQVWVEKSMTFEESVRADSRGHLC